MKNRLLHILFIVLLSIFLTSFTNSIYHSSGYNYSLFKIERSKDSNEIIYDINITPSGNLNPDNPINVYWIKHTHNKKIEPLTWIQKKFAYGLNFLSIKETEVKFRFVSYSKRDFVIKKNAKGNYQVFTNSQNKVVIVNRIYIQIDGGTFWIPNITRVELHATDLKTGKEVIEIIKI